VEFLLERFNPTRFFVWMTLGPLDAKHHTLSVLHVPSTPHAHTKRIPPAYHRCTSSSSQTHCIHVPDVPHSYTRHTSRTRQAHPICLDDFGPVRSKAPYSFSATRTKHTSRTHQAHSTCIPQVHLIFQPDILYSCTRRTSLIYQTHLTHTPSATNLHTRCTSSPNQTHSSTHAVMHTNTHAITHAIMHAMHISNQTHCIHVPDVPHSYTRHTSRTRQAHLICIPGAPHLQPDTPVHACRYAYHHACYHACHHACHAHIQPDTLHSCTRRTSLIYQTHLMHTPSAPNLHTRCTSSPNQTHSFTHADMHSNTHAITHAIMHAMHISAYQGSTRECGRSGADAVAVA
jgi:hypothetical protein